MRIALDFDGVLHDHEHPVEGRRMGPPIEGALESVNSLLKDGHQLCVFTVNKLGSPLLNHVTDWLRFYGFPVMPVFNTKPNADLYIDDKGLRFYEWESALEDIRALQDIRADRASGSTLF